METIKIGYSDCIGFDVNTVLILPRIQEMNRKAKCKQVSDSIGSMILQILQNINLTVTRL